MVSLLRKARRPLTAGRSRPRVVILVKGGVGHNAHVRKSAHSLHEAGYEVLVLGARRSSETNTPWQEEDGFRLRVVPAPPLRAPLLRRWAEHRLERLTARRERLKGRLARLRADGTGRRVPVGDRIASRLLRRRYERVRTHEARLRERESRRRAQARSRRSADDPSDLARYEAAWWPLVRRLRPDVVHACDVSGLATALLAGRRGARVVYDAHEPKWHVAENGANAARLQQIAEHAAQADAVIATTGPLAELLVDQLDLAAAPALVHNAPSIVVGPPPRPGLRETAGVAGDEPLLVYAGVLTRRRRLEVVLEAMTMLPQVQLALVVSADDPLTTELLARADELAVSERVHVVPKVAPESVVPFVAGADVGVFPRVRDPAEDLSLPNKVFEYLHAGLPMVVSDCRAMADFVRRHGLGEVAAVDDPQAWARAIERALAPPHYRDRAKEWQALKEEWSWERQAESLVGVYRELVSSPRRTQED